MPYDGVSENFITESSVSGDYWSGSIYSDSLHDDFGLFLSNVEQSGSDNADSEVRQDQADYTDYSDILGSIDSSCSVLTEQVSTLSSQLDLVNTNIVVLNDNIKVGCGLLFTITFIVFIRTIFTVFNKVLGLNQA